ncbi:hypothetical protein Tco_0199650 [Tanacetum coccineum]
MAEIVLLRCSKEIKRLGFALVSPHQLASWFIAPKDAQDARLYTRLVLCKLELVDSLCEPVLSKGVKGVGLRWSKINFKKAVTQKIREYDQKLKALTNFNVSEAFEKVVQAKVLTKIKKLLPTRIPKAVANYVRPRLNTSVYYKQGMEDMISDRWSKETHHNIFKALNGIHHREDSRIDFFKEKMSTRIEGNVYSDLSIKSVVHVVINFSPSPIRFVERFNNVTSPFIRRVVIQNRVDDIQLEVESYQQTLNLTKPIMFFEGIDQKIPSTMTAMHKGIVYLNQYNIKSLMKLSEVKNEGRDSTDMDVEQSNEMVDKIDKVLKRRERLRRLGEYVGRRPKTVNPRTFVRPV